MSSISAWQGSRGSLAFINPKEPDRFRPSSTCTAARGTTAIGRTMPASTERWRPKASWSLHSISASRRRRAILLRSVTSIWRVRWLKAHAADFNGTTAVGAFGNSSGGHQVVLSALRPRHPAYSALPLANHPEIDASLAYVIAGWPVICPLYRFHFAKEFNRQEHIQAHVDYWGTEEAMAEGSPQTIVDEDEQVDLPPILIFAEGERQKPSAGNAGALHRVLSKTRRSDRRPHVRRPAGAPHGAIARQAGDDARDRHRHRIHSAAKLKVLLISYSSI